MAVASEAVTGETSPGNTRTSIHGNANPAASAAAVYDAGIPQARK
jgi:hypothetical protein